MTAEQGAPALADAQSSRAEAGATFTITHKGKVATFAVPGASPADQTRLRECLLSMLGPFGHKHSSIQREVRPSRRVYVRIPHSCAQAKRRFAAETS